MLPNKICQFFLTFFRYTCLVFSFSFSFYKMNLLINDKMEGFGFKQNLSHIENLSLIIFMEEVFYFLLLLMKSPQTHKSIYFRENLNSPQ